MSDIKAIKQELLETLEEYCHDHEYGLQTYAGLARLVDRIEEEAYNKGYAEGVFNASLKPFMDKKMEGRAWEK